jgi:hypothetical protein
MIRWLLRELRRIREGYGPARPEDFTGEDRYPPCFVFYDELADVPEEVWDALEPDDLHLTFPAWEKPTPVVEDDPWAEWHDHGGEG